MITVNGNANIRLGRKLNVFPLRTLLSFKLAVLHAAELHLWIFLTGRLPDCRRYDVTPLLAHCDVTIAQ